MSSKLIASEVPSPFPPWVAFAAMVAGAELPLLPEEEASMGPAVSPKRRRDFILGRSAARAALRLAGGPDAAILRGEAREPLFPDGYVGSISHSCEVAVAVVAKTREIRAIGIDIQRVEERFTSELNARFASEGELGWIKQGPNPNERAAMLFSAKESIYKAIRPLVGVWFGFGSAELNWCSERAAFRGIVRPAPDKLYEVDVCITRHDAYVIAGVLIGHDS